MKKRLLLFTLLFLMLSQAHACLIFCAKTEGNVWVGNHEEWFANDAAVRILLLNEECYGSVIFTFLSEGWAQE